jgi:hypothetical protein
MRRMWALAVGLTLIVGVRAGPDDPPKSPAEELKQLQQQVTDAQKAAVEARQKWQKEEDADKKKELQQDMQKANVEASKLLAANQKKAIEIAKADPKSDTGLDAALWGWMSLRSDPDELKSLVDLVMEHHVADKKIGPLMSPLNMLAQRDPKALETMALIAEKNPNKPVQAAAIFAMADFYKNKAEPYGRKPPADADELAKKAEEAFERIEKNYADIVQFRNRTYGVAATSALFELRNLRVGKNAPEVDGEDADGVKFKLSDYRGKVVMLDFWGHW